MSRRRVYPSPQRGLGRALRALGWALCALVLLAVLLFFLLRRWTVYDDAGAHIVFPWASAEAA